MRKKIDIKIWQRYWRLKVLWETHPKKWVRCVLCKCDCWKELTCYLTSLRSNNTKSCWCLQRDKAKQSGKYSATHWMSRTKIYDVWFSMKARCYRETHHAFNNYWWRWITYDEKREKFENFYEDMWDTYKKWLTLDRIDNDWNYNKKNCRWVSRKIQCNNSRRNHVLVFNWKEQTMSERADELWIKYATLNNRISTLGWPTKKALTYIDTRWK